MVLRVSELPADDNALSDSVQTTRQLLDALSVYRQELGDLGCSLELLLRSEGAGGEVDQQYLQSKH